MKKSFLFLGFTFILFSSCKKDYTCECTLAGSTVVFETIQLKNMTEKDAVTKCDTYDEVITLTGQSILKDCSL